MIFANFGLKVDSSKYFLFKVTISVNFGLKVDLK